MTFLEQSFDHNHSDFESGIAACDLPTHFNEIVSEDKCGRPCPDCEITSYCAMNAGHWESHRCSEGHSF
jgi:hypothetical protein